jgi:hypothetical protein
VTSCAYSGVRLFVQVKPGGTVRRRSPNPPVCQSPKRTERCSRRVPALAQPGSCGSAPKFPLCLTIDWNRFLAQRLLVGATASLFPSMPLLTSRTDARAVRNNAGVTRRAAASVLGVTSWSASAVPRTETPDLRHGASLPASTHCC